MTVQAYAIVSTGGSVLNIALWDGVSTFNVSPNTPVLCQGNVNAQVGGTYSGGVFTPPSVPPTPQGSIYVNSPSSGNTVTLPTPAAAPNGIPQQLYVILEPSATLAALTVTMPPGPVNDGSIVTIYSTHAVTALTLNGATVNNAPTSMAALTQYNIIWSAQYNVWFHLGPSA